ncbi:MAG TPA: hypothetical protein VF992_01015 [Thermoplasmata archaeon]
MAGKRVAVVTIAFVATLVLIAVLALATALGTGGEWFTPSVASQSYVVTLIGSVLLVLGLAIAASLHVASIGREVARLDERIAVVRGSARAEMRFSAVADRDVDAELDATLGTMERDVAVVEVRTPMPVTRRPGVPTMQEARSLIRELVSERFAVRQSLAGVRWAIAPAVAAAIVFGAIASVMLPAVDGFARWNYQLNTTLILFLAYGWPVLVAWTVTAIAISRPIKPL